MLIQELRKCVYIWNITAFIHPFRSFMCTFIQVIHLCPVLFHPIATLPLTSLPIEQILMLMMFCLLQLVYFVLIHIFYENISHPIYLAVLRYIHSYYNNTNYMELCLAVYLDGVVKDTVMLMMMIRVRYQDPFRCSCQE